MAKQRTLFDAPIAKKPVSLPHNGTPTSRAAAESCEPQAGTDRRRVLDYVAGRGSEGATRDEIAAALQLKIQTVCGRVNDLVRQGNLRASEQTRPTESGRAAAVLRLVR